MASSEIDPASRSRRMLAGAVDWAIVGGAAWLARRRSAGASIDRGARWKGLFGPASELVRQQIGSPGQRLLGLRTVDRRTGRRLELWRTLVLLSADMAGLLLVRRIAPAPLTPAQERDRMSFLDELNAINERHRDDPQAREAEQRQLYARQPLSGAPTLARIVGPILLGGLIKSRLRRRLAPTTDALISRAGPRARRSVRSRRA